MLYFARVFLTSLILVGLVALAACTPGTTATSASPCIVITSPSENSTAPPGPVTVTVSVCNFTLVDKLGQPNVAGEGHIHYFLDANPIPTTPGKPALTAPGTYAPTAATSYTWPNVTAGTHTFAAELINNDHTPLNPPLISKVTVTVSATATGTTTGVTTTPTGTAMPVASPVGGLATPAAALPARTASPAAATATPSPSPTPSPTPTPTRSP